MSHPKRPPEYQQFLDDLGQRLLQARKARGVKTGAIGEELGLGRATIRAWETGMYEPKPFQLQAYARALGVPVSALLGETELSTVPRQDVTKKITLRLKHELAKLVLEDVNLRQLVVVQHMNDVLDRVVGEIEDE